MTKEDVQIEKPKNENLGEALDVKQKKKEVKQIKVKALTIISIGSFQMKKSDIANLPANISLETAKKMEKAGLITII